MQGRALQVHRVLNGASGSQFFSRIIRRSNRYLLVTILQQRYQPENQPETIQKKPPKKILISSV